MPEEQKTSPEKTETPVSKNPETREKANEKAEKKLKTVVKKPTPAPEEDKQKWSFNTVGVTGGGDNQLNMTTTGPTLTSPNGETRITAGFTTSSEKPESGMKAENKSGIGFNVSTTPESIGRGMRNLGNGIKNLFKKKK